MQPLDCFVSGRSILLAGRAEAACCCHSEAEDGGENSFQLAITHRHHRRIPCSCVYRSRCMQQAAGACIRFLSLFILCNVRAASCCCCSCCCCCFAVPCRFRKKPPLARPVVQVREIEFFFYLSLADAIHLETFTVQLGPHLNNSFIMKLIFHCASIFCAVCSCGRLHNLLVLMQWKSFISCGHTRFQRLERPARNIPRHDVDLPLRPFHFSSPPSISLPALLFYLR